MDLTATVTELKTIWQDDYFTICLDEDDRMMFYKIHGYPRSSDQIRQGHDELYRIAREMHRKCTIRYLIADLTDAKILLISDIRFIGTVSYPRLAKTGIRKLAILLKDDFHVKMNVQKTLTCMKSNVFQQVKLYPSVEPALAWFRMYP
ncbi:MAG TPA: hypothetical protein VK658_03910 [Chryseolinea sp.]|nr:hypothetical protein [Chryseolinea sp.]